MTVCGKIIVKMLKKLAGIIFSLALLLSFNPALAKAPDSPRTLTLPPAADNSPVISLGTAQDPQSGKLVEGFAIIHFKDNFTHKPNHKPGAGQGGSACFTYLSQGAKWKEVEPWIVNPNNTRNLAPNFIKDNLTSNIAKWEDAADGVVGNSTEVDILGSGSTTKASLAADTSSPDNQNEVYFADISSPGAIAVTIVWGIFRGPPQIRELVEWDQVYDDEDFDWSADGEVNKMDFENIATHELGHSVGLGDLYESACSEETMYGYASNGETKKGSLESGDIAGIDKLY